jgi:hypothetical protein
LPGYDITQIKVDTIKINNQIGVTEKAEIVDERKGFLGEVLKVEFDRFSVLDTMQSIWPGAECLVTISGELEDNSFFSKTVRVQVTKVSDIPSGNPITVRLLDSQGNGLEGGFAEYFHDGSWQPIGTTGSDGTISTYLPVIPWKIRMTYEHIKNWSTQDISEDPVVTFNTEDVLVTLEDSQGNGLSGGVAEYQSGYWYPIGTTNENGEIHKEMLPTNLKVKMTYEYITNRVTQDISEDTVVTFSTQDVLVTLKTCQGVGLEGGVAEYQSGYWRPIGTTDENGEIHKEMLPANLKFKMSYAYGADRFYQDTASDTSVDFTTTKVTIDYPGTVKYQSGYWRNFTLPTMEMMPGTYLFKFEGAGPTIRENLTISGCEFYYAPIAE